MNNRKVRFTRKTKETDVIVELSPDAPGSIEIATGVAFFDHLLTAMAFHGDFSLKVSAQGDPDIDPHHLVEDTGLVLGESLKKLVAEYGHVNRFGHAVIPMDEAISEIIIDACGRPTLVFKAAFPQERVGDFDLSLLREFFIALTNRASISLHAHIRYGENSHHMAECLFKALGKALKQSYSRKENVLSTKGTLDK